jgi:hypothetical protein
MFRKKEQKKTYRENIFMAIINLILAVDMTAVCQECIQNNIFLIVSKFEEQSNGMFRIAYVEEERMYV